MKLSELIGRLRQQEPTEVRRYRELLLSKGVSKADVQRAVDARQASLDPARATLQRHGEMAVSRQTASLAVEASQLGIDAINPLAHAAEVADSLGKKKVVMSGQVGIPLRPLVGGMQSRKIFKFSPR